MSSIVRTEGQYHDHLRRLLDERTARANMHGRLPSSSLSDFSDSPSIYSHALFSPRPLDKGDDGAYIASSHYREPSESTTSIMSDRQRLNIPNASSLDLDDDARSFAASTYAPENDDSASTEEADPEDDGEIHRVSAYGPKMTVHSRAPWEVGEEGPEDVGDPDTTTKRGGFKFSKGDKGRKAKGAGGHHGPDERPSMDSLRSQSQSRGKQSFDTVSSNISAGGALLALAQASMSSTSLALPQAPSPSPQTSLRDKLALPRFRSRTPSQTNSKTEQDQRAARPNFPAQSPYSSPSPHFCALSPSADSYRLDSRTAYVEPPSSHTLSHHHEFHPYANPDLVRAFSRDTSPARRLEELHALAYSAPHSPAVVPNSESTATLTESSTASTISLASKCSDTTASLTPNTSLSSVPTHNELSPTTRTFGKGISGPISIEGASMASSQTRTLNDTGQALNSGRREVPFPPGGFAGWQESMSSAPIKLISLQEAQAQARERSRSATVNSAPFVVEHQPHKLVYNNTRTRMRTTSAGAKTKKLASASAIDLHSSLEAFGDILSPTPHTAPPPTKTVSRKKSGFLRLFNGREKAQSPPPVPSLSMETMTMTPPPPFLPARTRKQSTHRVPVPSITPSLMVDMESKSSSESRSDSSESAGSPPPALPTLPSGHNVRQLSLRRNAPGLSIVAPSPPSTYIKVESSLTPTTATDTSYNSSSNAGPDQRSPEFVALSLRPVSMAFSAELAGQIGSVSSGTSRPSLTSDSGTPSTTIISPRSPESTVESPLQRKKPDVVAANGFQEDQAAVIQALQDQILAARRSWQREVWELEGQVRDLKAEVDDLRAANKSNEYCPACGRGYVGRHSEDDACLDDLRKVEVKVSSVVNRPRARTGVGSRFVNRT